MKWIPVTEELPEPWTIVICSCLSKKDNITPFVTPLRYDSQRGSFVGIEDTDYGDSYPLNTCVTHWMSLPEPYVRQDRYFVTTKYSNGVSDYEVKDRSQRDRTVFQSNVWKESKSVCMSLNRVQPTAKKSESKLSRYYVSDSFWDGIYSVVDKEKTETLQDSNRFGMATRFAAVIPFQSNDKSEADAVCDTLNKLHSEKQ